MKIKLLIILSNIQKALEHEWFVSHIDRNKFDLSFAMINGSNSAMDQFLIQNNVPVYHFNYNSKIDIIPVTFRLMKLIRKLNFDIVHTHLFEANICGILASTLSGTKARIITRHHSDYHHTWHPHAVIYDRIINFLSSGIIAVSGIVKQILVDWEKVNPAKVHLVHHGFDISLFSDPSLPARSAQLKDKHNIPVNRKVIGVVSRFIEWKGVQHIIPAFQKLIDIYPDFHLVLANASGTYKSRIVELLEKLPSDSYTLIEFENDGPALFTMFDYFVHVPVSRESEAFGQVYIEALMSRTPSVFTASGIAADIGRHNVNCLIVPFGNSDAIFNALSELINNPEKANEIAEKGFNLVRDAFDVKLKIRKLEQIYIKACE